MNDNKLIAGALLEIAKNSTTTFLDIGKKDKELIEAAKKLGIELPSPDLMVMKTVYAEIDKVNLNGVILPHKAVEAGLKTLIGKQCNWEHDGAGFVCGYTIDAKINKDKIETINVLFKSLFIDQADELKEKVKSGDASVSFEIWNRDPETGKSVVKELQNGFKEISPIIFHGTGVLLTHQPACPVAKIFKLVAKNLTDTAGKTMHRVFEENLVYAQLAIENNKKEEKFMTKCEICGKEFETSAEEKICVECASLPKEETQAQISEEKVEKIEEKLPEETKTEVKPEETKTDAQTAQKAEEPVAETKSEETKVEETKEAPKAETEAKVEEPKVEEKAEETKEEAQPIEVIEPKVIVKVTRIFSDLYVDTYKDGTISGTSEGKSTSKTITEYKDGTEDVVESESEYKKKFDFAELEAEVNKAKAEKDKEISNLKKELGQKDQEIADLKNPKVEETKDKKLEVGDVSDKEQKTELQKAKDNVDTIIASKHKK